MTKQACFSLIGISMLVFSMQLWAFVLPRLLPYPRLLRATYQHIPYAIAPRAFPLPGVTDTKPKILTLRDAIFLALRNNPDVRNADLDRVVQKFSLEVAHNEFEPKYSLTGNFTYNREGGASGAVTPTVSLKTPLGTQLNVALDHQQGRGGSSTNATISVEQPLMRGFGPAVNLASWQDAVDGEKVNRLRFKQTIMDTLTRVVSDYNALVQGYNTLKVDKDELRQSEKTLAQTKIKIKIGRVAPAILIQQQSTVASQKLAIINDKNTIKQAYFELLNTLGLSPQSNLMIDKTIRIYNMPIPNLEKSIDTAQVNNTGYLTSLIGLDSTKRQLIVAKDAQRWTLNMVASASTELGRSGAGFGGIADMTDVGNDSVALNLDIPIDNKQDQQQLVNAQIAYQQAQINIAADRRNLQKSVLQAYEDLVASQQAIVQARKSVKLAQITLNNERIKLNYGQTTLTDVNTLQQALITQQINLINVQIGYINSYVSFENVIGILLNRWNIKLIY